MKTCSIKLIIQNSKEEENWSHCKLCNEHLACNMHMYIGGLHNSKGLTETQRYLTKIYFSAEYRAL